MRISGTSTGEWIYTHAGRQFKKLSLELGGKNANIIFEDANFDEAVSTSVRSSFSNSGQICLCGSRILVEEGIFDKFVSGNGTPPPSLLTLIGTWFRDQLPCLIVLCEKTEKLVVGDPKSDSTDMGPVNSKPHMERIIKYINMAQEEGAKIHTGGPERVHVVGLEDGYFLRPTIITG